MPVGDKAADQPLEGKLEGIPRHSADADLPPGIPAAQSGRKTPMLGGPAKGHGGIRTPGRAAAEFQELNSELKTQNAELEDKSEGKRRKFVGWAVAHHRAAANPE